MQTEELIQYLEKKFNRKFSYKPCYDLESFTEKIELFIDNDISIGIFGHPVEMYQDICYMFGSRKDDFYNDAIVPCNYKIPDGFSSIDELANNEIQCLYTEIIKNRLNELKLK